MIPLEKVFKRISSDKSQFPRNTIDYWIQYEGFLNYLIANIYNHIDAGLAANSDNSGFYTAHNAEHFDEVVHYAGRLLGVETGDEEVCLTGYELYMLLIAIRIHDVGNIHGREDHEKKCFYFLRNCGPVLGDNDAEKKIIAKIAEAHGGKTNDGSKDTISGLEERYPLGKEHVRLRLLASIVRFADEICENRSRAPIYLLDHGKVPKHNEIYHKYAASIHASVVSHSERRLTLSYKVKVEDIAQPWGCASAGEKTSTYLIDEILERLEKMDRERKYCNRFSREIYTIDTIRATIGVINEDQDTIENIIVPDLCDSGYPDENRGYLRERLKEYCGSGFYKDLSKKIENNPK